MSWRVWSVSTLNWGSRIRVEPDTFPWGRVLNGGKGGQCTFKLGDEGVAESANKVTLAPWSRMLVAEFQGLILYAGFVTASDYDFDTQTFTVDHEDFWSVLSRRLVSAEVTDGIVQSVLIYTGDSPETMIKHSVYEGQNDAARFNLPVVLPPDQPGSLDKTFYGYQLPTIASAIKEFMNGENAPDVDFFPRWIGDTEQGLTVEWLLRMGALTDGEWSWDASAPETTVSGLHERRDGTKMANRVVAIGEGSETSMKARVADGSAASAFLPLDVVTSYKDEDDEDKLAAQARADLAARKHPTTQVSMDVEMNEDFAAHQLRLGGTVNWHTQGDPYFDDGWTSSRLIEFSGDLTDKIHLEFQTAGG